MGEVSAHFEEVPFDVAARLILSREGRQLTRLGPSSYAVAPLPPRETPAPPVSDLNPLVWQGRLRSVRELLILQPELARPRSDTRVPIEVAASGGLREMVRLLLEAGADPDPGLRVAAAHRVGALVVGDVALIAAVAAPHRTEAFTACAELVQRIKTGVPIWKRQHLASGATEWVGL